MFAAHRCEIWWNRGWVCPFSGNTPDLEPDPFVDNEPSGVTKKTPVPVATKKPTVEITKKAEVAPLQQAEVTGVPTFSLTPVGGPPGVAAPGRPARLPPGAGPNIRPGGLSPIILSVAKGTPLLQMQNPAAVALSKKIYNEARAWEQVQQRLEQESRILKESAIYATPTSTWPTKYFEIQEPSTVHFDAQASAFALAETIMAESLRRRERSSPDTSSDGYPLANVGRMRNLRRPSPRTETVVQSGRPRTTPEQQKKMETAYREADSGRRTIKDVEKHINRGKVAEGVSRSVDSINGVQRALRGGKAGSPQNFDPIDVGPNPLGIPGTRYRVNINTKGKTKGRARMERRRARRKAKRLSKS